VTEPREPFVRWFLVTFSSQEYFIRILAMWIMLIAMHDAVRHGTIESSIQALLGMVLGYYFKDATSRCRCPEEGKKL
jgi:hypothetical protein